MDNIPLEDQLVIDELVEFWKTNNEPDDLLEHILRTPFQGCESLSHFFLTVRDDLRKGKRRKYGAYSVLAFRQFLEARYHVLYQLFTENQKAKAPTEFQIPAEYELRNGAYFYVGAKVMPEAITWTKPIEIERKPGIYKNVCWNCKGDISSERHTRCSDCGWYICGRCGSCKPNCNKTNMSVVHNEADDPFLPDFPDD